MSECMLVGGRARARDGILAHWCLALRVLGFRFGFGFGYSHIHTTTPGGNDNARSVEAGFDEDTIPAPPPPPPPPQPLPTLETHGFEISMVYSIGTAPASPADNSPGRRRQRARLSTSNHT